MKRTLLLIATLALLTTAQLHIPAMPVAHAAVTATTQTPSIWSNATNKDLLDPADFTRKELRISKEDDFEKFALRGILFFLGFLGVIMLAILVVGGYQMLSSMGEEEKYTKGKKTVINTLIGFVVIILSYAMVNELLSSTSIFRTIFSIFGK